MGFSKNGMVGCHLENGRVSAYALAEASDMKRDAYHRRYQWCPEAWILGQRFQLD